MSQSADQRAARFFDGFAETFDSLYDGRRSALWRWIDRRFRSDMFVRHAWTSERLGDLEGRTVLDIGCGSGPYLVEALRRGARQVMGVDPAPHMLALARERLHRAGAGDRGRLVKGCFRASKPACTT